MASDFDEIAKKYGADEPSSDFGHILKKYGAPEASLGETAFDVAKQVPVGLVTGTEQIPAFPAQAAGLVGGLVDKVLPESWKNAPLAGALGFDTSGPSAADQQAALRELAAKRRGQGIAEYLPEAKTPEGKAARGVAEFVPSAVAASTYSIPRAIGVGAATGLASEGAGAATEGTALEPAARIAGALVGGTVAGRAVEGVTTRQAAKALQEKVREESNVLYDQFRNSGFKLNPQAAQTYAAETRRVLKEGGMVESAPETNKVLDRIAREPFRDPQEFQSAYKQLGSTARKATDAEERKAANIAQERLLTFLEKDANKHLQRDVLYVSPQGEARPALTSPEDAAAIFQRANANWAAASRAANIDQRIAKGELKAGANYSGLNLENELRRRVGVLSDKDVGRGFSEAEREAFKKFGEGTIRSNAPRYIKNFLGGGGGLGALLTGGGAAGAGAYYGFDPATGSGAAILGGLGLAKYGNMRALQRARDLELQLLARSPYAKDFGVPGVRSGGARALAAPTLATLGEEY